MEIDADALCVELEKEFDGYSVEVLDDDSVHVRDNYPAGMHFKQRFIGFKENLEEFVAFYTKDWHIKKTISNRIEGYSSAIILREKTE